MASKNFQSDLYNGLPLFVGLGHVLRVDKIYGNDTLASPSGYPYATVEAALADSAANDLIYLFPGTHTLAAGITIPADVNIEGIDQNLCVMSLLGVTADTTMVTMSDRSSMANLTLRLTSAQHHTLKGLLFPGVTAATVKVNNVTVVVDNSAAPLVGSSNVTGVHSSGLSVLTPGTDAMIDCVIAVTSIGLGAKRGILVDTNAQQFSVHNVNITLINAGGAGSYIGAESNQAAATLFLHGAQINAPTADISQTLGVISLNSTTLFNSTANGLGFTVVIYPPTFVYADPGPTPGGVTRYMRPGSATVSATEIFQRIATQCLVKSFAIRAVTGPGAARVDTFTVRKNGVDTLLTVTLTGAQITNINEAVSVTFSKNDDISVKIVTAAGSTLADIVATIELY